MDKFMAHLKISIVVGVICSCPLWLYQLWQFVAPGLYRKERKYMFSFISLGSLLFLAGSTFSYFVALPMAFQFLFTFGGDQDKPMITIEHYMDFFTQFSLMFGVSFELPLVLSILGMLGIVSQKFLIEKARYAVMILAIISAIITPPDLMSMLIMLVPLILLYFLGVVLVGFILTRTDAFWGFVGLIIFPELSLVVVLGKVLLEKLVAFSIKSILKSSRRVTSNKTMANNNQVMVSTKPMVKGLSSFELGMRNK
jgi:sec-independent protein translocase protein TatC